MVVDPATESNPITGLTHAIVLSFCYVGSLYIWKGSLTVSRNEKSQIRRRTISVLSVSLLSIFYCFIVYLLSNSHDNYFSLLRFHSNIFSHALAILIVIFLNSCLFFGPIVDYLLNCNYLSSINGLSIITIIKEDFLNLLKGIYSIGKIIPFFLFDHEKYKISNDEDLYHFRAIILGPVTEEIVFRSCLIYVLYFVGGFSHLNSLLISSFLFGVAHCHHIIEYLLHGEMSLISAMLNVIIQLSYTFIFGLYCGYLLDKTKSSLAAIILHAYCNVMGLPNFMAMKNPLIGISYVIGLISFGYAIYHFPFSAFF
ncbi:hypothetical protein ABK040_016535 [Willaertia magna]